MGASHSTATLSPGGTRSLYGLRLMHRPNIFLSCFGPRAGQALIFCSLVVLTLTLESMDMEGVTGLGRYTGLCQRGVVRVPEDNIVGAIQIQRKVRRGEFRIE